MTVASSSLSEDDVHEAVAETLAVAIAPPGTRSPSDVLWFSIEHRNAKSAREGAARKRRGVVRGIPDILVMHGRRYLWVELKRPKDGEVSKEQKRLHLAIRSMGGAVAICTSAQQVLAYLHQEGVPMRARIAA
nr:VRR-NUC domain-containing protein [uncultured Lichenicoccus sp.]